MLHICSPRLHNNPNFGHQIFIFCWLIYENAFFHLCVQSMLWMLVKSLLFHCDSRIYGYTTCVGKCWLEFLKQPLIQTPKQKHFTIRKKKTFLPTYCPEFLISFVWWTDIIANTLPGNFLLRYNNNGLHISQTCSTNTWCFGRLNDTLEIREILAALLFQHVDVTIRSLT